MMSYALRRLRVNPFRNFRLNEKIRRIVFQGKTTSTGRSRKDLPHADLNQDANHAPKGKASKALMPAKKAAAKKTVAAKKAAPAKKAAKKAAVKTAKKAAPKAK